MQKPTRYYITKSGEEPKVRSVRVEQQPVPAAFDEARRTHVADNGVTVETVEQRRSVIDMVQGAIQKRQFFS